MTHLLLIPGSLRSASASRAIAHILSERLASRARCTLADIGALPHYNADVSDNPEVAAFLEQVGAADAVVFITPEYNYSIPGVLKNAIDWASRPAFESVFKDKPCFVMTVSGGGLGGVRAQAHLKYILSGLLARTHAGKEVVIPMVNEKVARGALSDPVTLAFAEAELAAFLGSLP